MVRQQHIVIVGAGIVGLSTAYSLLTRGVRNVTILEQATVDHIRSSSHGFSRLLRFEYGSDAFYSHMVGSSLKRWKNLEYRTGQTLYTSTGLLMLGNDDDRDTLSSYRVVREMGLPIERLSQDACASRFPQFDPRPYNLCLYNQEAGILHASTILQTLRDLILDLGGEIYESCRVTRITNENQYYPIRLHLSSGQAIQADRIVLAAGPWIHRLLPHLYLPVRITRQYLIYFS
ncbi:MAG TPA: FAD-dependent oxidoreductase, partial [Ktedonobacteraceae bacterium]|nr:FAD-dependent oxidoreductase [Ktedonobacteraceae bacterium]